MGVRDTVAKHLPIPNTDSQQEMWIAATILSNVVRTSSEWIFLGGLILVLLYVIGLVLYKTCLYIFEVYTERLREHSSHKRVFLWALCIALIVGTVGIGLMFWDERQHFGIGFIILANTFCLFSLFTAGYDWWVSRPQAKSSPSLKGLTAEEVIRMHKTVATAKASAQRDSNV